MLTPKEHQPMRKGNLQRGPNSNGNLTKWDSFKNQKDPQTLSTIELQWKFFENIFACKSSVPSVKHHPKQWALSSLKSSLKHIKSIPIIPHCQHKCIIITIDTKVSIWYFPPEKVKRKHHRKPPENNIRFSISKTKQPQTGQLCFGYYIISLSLSLPSLETKQKLMLKWTLIDCYCWSILLPNLTRPPFSGHAFVHCHFNHSVNSN